MDKIEKLLRKISKKDRQRLLNIVELILAGKIKNLNVRKIKNTDFFRAKRGNFRIIFHYDRKEIIIDSIRMRNEKTYKI